MCTNIELNTPAPDFTLKNTKGKDWTLADFKGSKKIVLLFFPLAFTRPSVELLGSTRDNMKLYSSLDAKVIGISVDSHFALRAFKKAENLNFTLLSDFNKDTSRRYGVLSDDHHGMKGVPNQATFIIDRKGVIRHKEVVHGFEEHLDFKAVQQVLAAID